MSTVMPLFPTVVSPVILPPLTTTIPSIMLPAPAPSSSFVLPYINDPFRASAAQALSQQAAARSPGVHVIGTIPTPASQEERQGPRVIDMSSHPAKRFAELQRTFDDAREAIRTGDTRVAADNYAAALRLLTAPLDERSIGAPFYSQMPRGEELFQEALFGAASYSDPKSAVENLSYLNQYIKALEKREGAGLDLAKAQILKAYMLMQYATSVPEPQKGVFRKASGIVDGVIADLSGMENGSAASLLFSARLLSVELLARRIELAHNRRDFKARRALVENVRSTFKDLTSAESTDAQKEVIATYGANTAVLFARLGLWGPALERARSATSHPFETTQAAQRLLTEKIFEPFTDGKRFFDAGEIRLKARSGSWRKRVKAAVAMAHAESLGQTAKYGALGMFAGLVLEAMAQTGHGVWSAVIFAMLFSMYNRLHNGWKSEEALYAGELGQYDRTVAESAHDVASLTFKGGLDMLAWTVPAAFIESGADGADIFSSTLGNAADLYGKFANGLMNLFVSLSDPSTYSKMASTLPAPDAFNILYNVYTKSAGLLFAANLLSPAARRYTEKYALYFLPGAIMLSADLGMYISGQAPMDFTPNFESAKYWDRVERAAIVGGEMAALMLTSGILALKNTSTKKQAVLSFLNSFRPSQANYGLPLAAAIVTGITSPLGGMMQKGTTPDEFALIAIQGAAITFSILPITLLLSGVLKRTVPIGAGIAEAWQDSKGENIFRRLYETTMGGLASWNIPYAHNRIYRSGTLDLLPAGLRAMAGWDTNEGQALMSGTNYFAGNGAATSTWPETAGTQWDRDATVKWTQKAREEIEGIEQQRLAGTLTDEEAKAKKIEALSQLQNFFTTAGQTMHASHLFVDHARIRDRLWPLYSFTRAFVPPTFPLVPNQFLYANIHQILEDGHPEKMSSEQVETLLGYALAEAGNPDKYTVLRPLVQTLAMARDSRTFGPLITSFFEANSWILDVLDIDMQDTAPPGTRSRRINRARVRSTVKVGLGEFEQAVRAHHRQPQGNAHFDGLFSAPPPRSPQSASGSQATVIDGSETANER